MKKAKKSTTKARKSAKPAARKSVKPAASGAKKSSGAGTYAPQPIQGMGWAPFRYPLQ